MRNIAITAAVIVFFAMAVAGLAFDQDSLTCAIRALVGAVLAYVAASVALKLAVDVMIHAVMGDGKTQEEQNQEEAASESE